jgi:poly(3-hydroxybutyrate) depolymerase
MINRTVFKKVLCAFGLFVSFFHLGTLNAQVARLPAFNVDIRQTSVSGLSAGGFMAVQFDVAFSSILKGAGIIAGGPYSCA